MDKEDLQKQLDRFLAYKNRNWSFSAKRNNKYYFDLLTSFLGKNDFNRESAQEFFDYLAVTGKAENTRRQAETAILAFVRWLFDEDVIARNWSRRIERTKVHRVPRILPSQSETIELIKKATAFGKRENVLSKFSKIEHRDCLLFIVTCAGTRNFETRAIKRNEVSISGKQILIREGKTGARTISIPEIPWVIEMLEKRVKERPPEEMKILNDRTHYKEDYSDLLFVVNGSRLEKIMKLAGKIWGSHLNVHDLRRICLRDLKRNGAGVDDIKNVAGHKNIETTLGYLSYDTLDQQKTLKNFSSEVRKFWTKEEKAKEIVAETWKVGKVVEEKFDGEFLTMKVRI